MDTTSSRQKLIDALRNAPPEMRAKLDSLKRIGADLSRRTDLVWHMLLQSMSGMGNNRGYTRLILNEANYRQVAWETLKTLPRSERLAHIHSALAAATVRMPRQKAHWLTENYDRIEQMGGVAAALNRMRSLQGRMAKLAFFRQFVGIGDKYGRNIWMDLCDPDFRDSIAIDVRLQKMYPLLGVPTKNYELAEAAMLDIASEAGLTGWELDRLLFHFPDHFLAAVGTSVVRKREPNESGQPAKTEEQIALNSEQQQTVNVVERWNRIYQAFEIKHRNTRNWHTKAEYARAMLRNFNGCIPLAVIVDGKQRKALSERLFNKPNDFNYVTYVLCMAVCRGALRRDGESLVIGDPGQLQPGR